MVFQERLDYFTELWGKGKRENKTAQHLDNVKDTWEEWSMEVLIVSCRVGGVSVVCCWQRQRNSTRKESWQSRVSAWLCWWWASCVWSPTVKPSKFLYVCCFMLPKKRDVFSPEPKIKRLNGGLSNRKQRRQMHNHMRQNMYLEHPNRNLANGPNHPGPGPEEIPMVDVRWWKNSLQSFTINP